MPAVANPLFINTLSISINISSYLRVPGLNTIYFWNNEYISNAISLYFSPKAANFSASTIGFSTSILAFSTYSTCLSKTFNFNIININSNKFSTSFGLPIFVSVRTCLLLFMLVFVFNNS